MAETEWDLYIDESGDFDSQEDDPLIAGILLPVGPPESNPAWQRKLLEDELPWIPWPIHTSEARNPVMHVLWPHARDLDPAEQIRAFASDAAEALKKKEAEVLNRAVTRIRKQRAPDQEDVRKLRAVLRHRKEEWSALQHLARRSYERLKSAARAIGESPRSSIILVGEPQQADAWPMRKEDDRYLTMLPALLQRAADAILQSPGKHFVRVHVMVRHVVDPTLGSAASSVGEKGAPGLHQRHVTAAIRTALGESAPKLQRRSSRVRFGAGLLGRNDDPNLRAGFVLADFAANALYRHFPGDARLAETCRLVRRKTRQRVTYSEEPRHPHIAASGRPFQYLSFTRGETTRKPLPGDAAMRPWAIEQANEWGTAL